MSKLTKVQLKQLVLEEFSKHKKLKDLQEKKKKIEESIKSIEESREGDNDDQVFGTILEDIIAQAQYLKQMLDGGHKIPDWAESLLVQAKTQTTNVYDFIRGEHEPSAEIIDTKETDLEEKHLSRAEQKAKESEVKKLKGNPRAVDSFKNQYGSDWKNVMYGKATNDAKNGH